eukprot:2680874-Pleurochrysis_carterae.AAC.1
MHDHGAQISELSRSRQGGGESLQNSLIKIERARDVPSRGSPAASPRPLAHGSRLWLMSCGNNPEANIALN